MYVTGDFHKGFVEFEFSIIRLRKLPFELWLYEMHCIQKILKLGLDLHFLKSSRFIDKTEVALHVCAQGIIM